MKSYSPFIFIFIHHQPIIIPTIKSATDLQPISLAMNWEVVRPTSSSILINIVIVFPIALRIKVFRAEFEMFEVRMQLQYFILIILFEDERSVSRFYTDPLNSDRSFHQPRYNYALLINFVFLCFLFYVPFLKLLLLVIIIINSIKVPLFTIFDVFSELDKILEEATGQNFGTKLRFWCGMLGYGECSPFLFMLLLESR